VAYGESSGRRAAAETALIKALSLAQHASAHMFLGIVLSPTNRVEQGIGECEYALAINPNLADAHCTLGVAKLFVGRATETYSTCKRRCVCPLKMQQCIGG
jgi:hypothetical protein